MTIARISSGILPWLVDRSSISAPDADALDLAEELALLDEPMPIKRETCLELEPTTRGVWPAVCNEPYEHRGPHCSRRGRLPISMSNQVVSAVTWESAITMHNYGGGDAAGDALCGPVQPAGVEVGSGDAESLPVAQRAIVGRWSV